MVGTVTECNDDFKSDGVKWARMPYCVSVSFGDDLEALQRSVPPSPPTQRIVCLPPQRAVPATMHVVVTSRCWVQVGCQG